MTTIEAPAPSWMIVELMGHQRMAGEVTEVTVAGKGFLRIDVPATDSEPAFTRFVSPDSVYALNPCSEDVARRAAAAFRPRVVDEWELPSRALPPATLNAREDEGDSDPVHPEDFRGSDEESHYAAPAAASARDPAFELSADDNQARPRKRCQVRGCLEQLFSDEEERAGLCGAHIAAGEEDRSCST